MSLKDLPKISMYLIVSEGFSFNNFLPGCLWRISIWLSRRIGLGRIIYLDVCDRFALKDFLPECLWRIYLERFLTWISLKDFPAAFLRSPSSFCSLLVAAILLSNSAQLSGKPTSWKNGLNSLKKSWFCAHSNGRKYISPHILWNTQINDLLTSQKN